MVKIHQKERIGKLAYSTPRLGAALPLFPAFLTKKENFLVFSQIYNIATTSAYKKASRMLSKPLTT